MVQYGCDNVALSPINDVINSVVYISGLWSNYINLNRETHTFWYDVIRKVGLEESSMFGSNEREGVVVMYRDGFVGRDSVPAGRRVP